MPPSWSRSPRRFRVVTRLLGEAEETVVELPTQVSHIFEEHQMPGRFGLNPSQQLPLNAFVELEELQTQLNLQYVPASARRKEPKSPPGLTLCC